MKTRQSRVLLTMLIPGALLRGFGQAVGMTWVIHAILNLPIMPATQEQQAVLDIPLLQITTHILAQ